MRNCELKRKQKMSANTDTVIDWVIQYKNTAHQMIVSISMPPGGGYIHELSVNDFPITTWVWEYRFPNCCVEAKGNYEFKKSLELT